MLDALDRRGLADNSYRGVLAIREGPWKLIPLQGGGGIREDLDAVDPDQSSGQLYNLDLDPGRIGESLCGQSVSRQAAQ